MKKKILVIGAGGHANSVIDILQQSNSYVIYKIIGAKKDLGKKFGKHIIQNTDADLNKLRKNCGQAVIAIGQIKNYKIRKKIYDKLIKLKFKIPKIFSKNSYVSKTSKIGLGTVIFNNVIINSKVKIGNNCIINNGALIEHDVNIGNNCHVSTGVILNGNVKIEDNCFIGSGSIIRENIKIKKNKVIPLGSKIFK